MSDAEFKSPAVQQYFERFGYCPVQIASEPHPELGMVIVIPSHNEPALEVALSALRECAAPGCAVEIIVVINSGELAGPEIRRQNEISFHRAQEFAATHSDERFQIHALQFPNLPKKKAGVGLARKIGMDEALRRFDRVGRGDGVILCFDADCTCDLNYLQEVERYFLENPKSPGCSIYFEHPLEGADDPRIYEGVMRYELHLRYYIEALRWSRFPHAFHTIGSSMAVRATIYQQQGGMNKRQAGEDFYFLHKIIPLGGFGEINETRVIASPRPSDRVPFGTGKAVRDYLDSGKVATYPLRAFEDLRLFFSCVPAYFRHDPPAGALPEALREFLALQHFEAALKEIRANTTTPENFERRFFRWFDGFLAMKYIHHTRDHYYGPGDLRECAGKLIGLCAVPNEGNSIRDLLMTYRKWQRFPERV